MYNLNQDKLVYLCIFVMTLLGGVVEISGYSLVKIGMLDPIITSYKLTANVNSYLLEYSQYPVNNTYNIWVPAVCPKTSKIKKKSLCLCFFTKKPNLI